MLPTTENHINFHVWNSYCPHDAITCCTAIPYNAVRSAHSRRQLQFLLR